MNDTRSIRTSDRPSRDRLVLLIVLAFAWLNFLLTVKWAHLAGSINGWKRPWYGAALIVATVLAIRSRRIGQPVRLGGLTWLAAGGIALMTVAFLANFPPSSWALTPFFDDWPPRFQSTMDALALLGRGAIVGWQWGFLGGYPTAADLTQNLMPFGLVPMLVFGPQTGFHLMHALLCAAIPGIVFLDLRAEGRPDEAKLSLFFALVCTTGMFGTLMPSGDTNSIAGVTAAMIALGGSRMAALGKRWGGVVLAAGLALALYSHAAFFGYAVIYLLLESVYYRSRVMAVRAAVASAAAVLSAMPLYLELLVYPGYFITNNLIYQPDGIHWAAAARQVFYNVEILLHPHRWYNDYLSLACVFLALFIHVAVAGRPTRAGFYAWMAVATMVLLRLNVRDVGYLFAREMHMLVPFAGPPLAAFILRRAGSRSLAWALIAIVGLYVQSSFWAIPHVSSVREFNPALIARLTAADGNLVLIEGSPHRDLDSDPVRRTERTPFDIHFESHLPEATRQRYFGQPWDGWHWTPYRANYVAGGAFRGEHISRTPPEAFIAVLRKWGIRHLFVWSAATRGYLDAQPEAFRREPVDDRWFRYELQDADARSVVTQQGSGTLEPLDQLAGRVRLSGVKAGTLVIVRMNYFPAWQARLGDRVVPLRALDGQLAFDAPADGDHVVELDYPPRRWLLVCALIAWLAGAALLSSRAVPAPARSSP